MPKKLVFTIDFAGGEQTVKKLYNQERALKELVNRYKEYAKVVNDPSIDKSSDAFKNADKEAKKLSISINNLKVEIGNTRKVLREQVKDFDIGQKPSTSIAALELAWTKLRQKLREMERDNSTAKLREQMTADAAKMKKEIDAFYKSIGDHKANVGNYPVGTQLLGDLANATGLGEFMGAATRGGAIGLAAYAGVQTMKHLYEVNKEIDTIQGNIKKTTGLTNDEVEQLTTNLAKLDSITSTADLLKIAEEAGRFGVSGAKGVEEFTKSVNLLAIALGDEMGGGVEHIATLVAQLSNVMYGATNDGEVMAKRFLAIGNSLNALANSGAATAEDIANVAQRMSSFLRPLGFTQAEILGISSALLESGINAERGATAFARIQSILRRNFMDVAKTIGMDAREFVALLDTKPVEAFNMVVTRTKEIAQNSGTALSAILKDMGINSQYSMEVFNAWGNNMELFNTRINQTNKFITETSSLLRDQTNITDTISGQWQRVKNSFNDLFINSGLQDGIKNFFSLVADKLSSTTSKAKDLNAELDKMGGRGNTSKSSTNTGLSWLDDIINGVKDAKFTQPYNVALEYERLADGTIVMPQSSAKAQRKALINKVKKVRSDAAQLPDDLLNYYADTLDALEAANDQFNKKLLLSNPDQWVKEHTAYNSPLFSPDYMVRARVNLDAPVSPLDTPDVVEAKIQRQQEKEAEAAKKSADKEQRARDRAAKLAAKLDMGAPDSIKDLQNRISKTEEELNKADPESTFFAQKLEELKNLNAQLELTKGYMEFIKHFLAEGGDINKIPKKFNQDGSIGEEFFNFVKQQYDEKSKFDLDKLFENYVKKTVKNTIGILSKEAFEFYAKNDSIFAKAYTPQGVSTPDYDFYLNSDRDKIQSNIDKEKERINKDQDRINRDNEAERRRVLRDFQKRSKAQAEKRNQPLLSFFNRDKFVDLNDLPEEDTPENFKGSPEEYKEHLKKKYKGRTKNDEKELEEIQKQAFATAKELEDAIFDYKEKMRQENLKRELKALDREYDAKKQQAQGNATLLEALEVERAEKEEKLRRKAFEDDKKAKIAQAVINAALAITSAFATGGNPIVAAILAAGVAVTTGLQIAAIRNSTYAEGGFTGDGFFKDDTGHKVAGIVHDNEYVINKKQVQKYPELVNFLEKDRLQQMRGYAKGGFVTNYSSVPNFLSRNTYQQEMASVDMKAMYEMMVTATREGTYQGSVKGVEAGSGNAYRLSERINRQQKEF